MPDEKITKKQKDYLASLVCQRISDDEANKQIIQDFTNNRNPRVANALKKGWNADKQDRVAYYIVKDPADGAPLLFFSLKCGEIHLPFVPENLERSVEELSALLNAACGCDAPEWAVKAIEQRKVNGVLPYEAFDEMFQECSTSMTKLLNYREELRREGENIIRTKKNFASVELVHICIHEPAREKWKAAGMGPQPMGKTLFWQFVVPVIQEVRRLLGCEYLYLFAADKKRDGTLTRYYRELGFTFRDDMNVNKPSSDFCCYFMCQEVKTLRNKQRDFFRNYNKTGIF